MTADSESCRNCADKIKPANNGRGWEALNGFPCVHGHVHEPWPELLYMEAPSEMPGVSIMRLISSPPSRN